MAVVPTRHQSPLTIRLRLRQGVLYLDDIQILPNDLESLNERQELQCSIIEGLSRIMQVEEQKPNMAMTDFTAIRTFIDVPSQSIQVNTELAENVLPHCNTHFTDIFTPVPWFHHYFLLHFNRDSNKLFIVDSVHLTPERDPKVRQVANAWAEKLKSFYNLPIIPVIENVADSIKQMANTNDCGVIVLAQIQAKLNNGNFIEGSSQQSIRNNHEKMLDLRRSWKKLLQLFFIRAGAEPPSNTARPPQLVTTPARFPQVPITPASHTPLSTASVRCPPTSITSESLPRPLPPIPRKKRKYSVVFCPQCSQRCTINNIAAHRSTCNAQIEQSVAVLEPLQNTRDISVLLDKLPGMKLHYTATKSAFVPDGLVCTICQPQRHDEAINVVPGLFIYDFKNGEKFGADQQPSTEFVKLREMILNHQKTFKHIKNAGKRDQLMKPQEQVAKPETRNHEIGLNVIAAAHSAIKDHHSFESFPRLLNLLATLKVDIGDINHSTRFISKVIPVMETVCRDEFTLQITTRMKGSGRPTPISAMMDKYTGPDHRSYLLIGVSVILNGTVKVLYISAPVMTLLTGEAHSELLAATLDEYLPSDWKRRLVSVASDGGILNLNYHNSFNRILSCSSEMFVSYDWDYAHLEELAVKNAKETLLSSWVVSVERVISHIHNDLGGGTCRQKLQEIGTRWQANLRSSTGFSTTKWVAHALNAYKNFHHNYAIYYTYWDEQQDPSLGTISTVGFVVECSALWDIYNQLSILSKTLQVPDLTYWGAKEAISNTRRNLERMSDATVDYVIPEEVQSIVDANGRPDLLFPHLADAIRQITMPNGPTYKNMPLLNHYHPSVTTRDVSQQLEFQNDDTVASIVMAITRVHRFVQRIDHELWNRYSAESEIRKEVLMLFSSDKIMGRLPNDVPPELDSYVDRARISERLQTSLTNLELKVQYRSFQSDLHYFMTSANYGSLTTGRKRELEKKFHTLLILGQLGSYPEIVHLLCGALLRLANESQVEGFGSNVKSILLGRVSMDPKTMNAELFITLSGPPINKTAYWLYEATFRKAGNLNFLRKSESRKLKKLETSKVVDGLNRRVGKWVPMQYSELSDVICSDEIVPVVDQDVSNDSVADSVPYSAADSEDELMDL